VERKIIKQGGNGHTIYLPKKWVDSQGLKAGESINIEEKGSQLILSNKDFKIPEKETTIKITKKDFHTYRGILGGLYRAGYQTINVEFDDISVIPLLEKASSSLYGFEVFDIGNKTCTIKGIYEKSSSELEQLIQKMIHTLSTIQEIVLRNIKEETHKEKEEVFQYRNNVLKYRDLVLRTITQLKLLDDKHFPFYQIAISLWNVVRNFNQMYQTINLKKKVSKKDLEILIQTSDFVKESFENISKRNIEERFSKYDKLRSKIHLSLNAKESSLISAFCLNIVIAAHSADSSIVILNFARN